jgi:hypothetical protein
VSRKEAERDGKGCGLAGDLVWFVPLVLTAVSCRACHFETLGILVIACILPLSISLCLPSLTVFHSMECAARDRVVTSCADMLLVLHWVFAGGERIIEFRHCAIGQASL